MCQLANRNPRMLTITGFGVVGIPANSCQLCQPREVWLAALTLLAADPYRDKVGWGWLGWHRLARCANRLEPLIIKAFGDMVGKLAQEIAIE
jgi:hypothetical protein